MTSAFGGQHSIQLSYGCGLLLVAPDVPVAPGSYKENGRARQSARPLLYFQAFLPRQAWFPASIGRCSARCARALLGSICRALAISWMCSGVSAAFS